MLVVLVCVSTRGKYGKFLYLREINIAHVIIMYSTSTRHHSDLVLTCGMHLKLEKWRGLTKASKTTLPQKMTCMSISVMFED